MKICGIDPGASGAIAVIDIERGYISVIDMPTHAIERNGKKKTEIAAQLVARHLEELQPDHVWLERVGAMPGQGVSSMFQFGRSVGTIEGIIAALRLPISYVTPQKWQKASGMRAGKDGSRQRAQELFPAFAQHFSRVKDNGRSDAALIAWYGATQDP
jgi:crossover junction endodeoxyribonuclease RuvC